MNLQESTQVIDCHIVNVTMGIIQQGGEVRSNRRPLCVSFAITSLLHFVPVDRVEYFSGFLGQERYVFMFLCFLKISLWTPS